MRNLNTLSIFFLVLLQVIVYCQGQSVSIPFAAICPFGGQNDDGLIRNADLMTPLVQDSAGNWTVLFDTSSDPSYAGHTTGSNYVQVSSGGTSKPSIGIAKISHRDLIPRWIRSYIPSGGGRNAIAGAIAVDGNDHAHVLFRDTTDSFAKLLKFDGTTGAIIGASSGMPFNTNSKYWAFKKFNNNLLVAAGKMTSAGPFPSCSAGSLYVVLFYSNYTLYNPTYANAIRHSICFGATGGSTVQDISYLTIDESENLYVNGYFNTASMSIGGYTISRPVANSGRCGFVIKFDSTLTPLAHSVTNSAVLEARLIGVSNSSVFAAYTYAASTSLTIGSVTASSGSVSREAMFKLDRGNLNAIWSVTYSATFSGRGIVIDPRDQNPQFFFMSTGASTETFGQSSISVVQYDSLILKLDTSNARPVWFQKLAAGQSTISIGNMVGDGVDVGSLAFAGEGANIRTNYGVGYTTNAGNKDVFVARLVAIDPVPTALIAAFASSAAVPTAASSRAFASSAVSSPNRSSSSVNGVNTISSTIPPRISPIPSSSRQNPNRSSSFSTSAPNIVAPSHSLRPQQSNTLRSSSSIAPQHSIVPSNSGGQQNSSIPVVNPTYLSFDLTTVPSTISANQRLTLQIVNLNTSQNSYSIAWTAMDITINSIVPLNSSMLYSIGTNLPVLSLREGTLQPGHSYTFSVSITLQHLVVTKSVTINVASKPTSGSCEISPSIGYSYSTYYTISCFNWTNSDGSSANITYSFHFLDQTIQQVIFLYPRSSQSNVSLPLPPGYGVNSTLQIIVRVYNSFLSQTVVELSTSVLPLVMSTSNFDQNNVTSTIAQGRIQEAQAMIISMVQLLNTGTSVSNDTAERQQLRNQYLEITVQLLASQNVSTVEEETNQKNAYMIQAITAVSSEFDSNTQQLALGAIQQIASTSNDAISFALLVKALSNTMNYPINTTATAVQLVTSVSTLMTALSKSMIIGDQDRTYVEENLHVLASKTVPNMWNGKHVSMASNNATVTIPASVIPPFILSSASSIEVLVVLLKKDPYGNSFKQQVNSDILDVKVLVNGVEIQLRELTENIVLKIPGLFSSHSSHRCTFWNTTTTTWESNGCKTTNSTTESILCECNHATEFAGQIIFINSPTMTGVIIGVSVGSIVGIVLLISILLVIIVVVVVVAVVIKNKMTKIRPSVSEFSELSIPKHNKVAPILSQPIVSNELTDKVVATEHVNNEPTEQRNQSIEQDGQSVEKEVQPVEEKV